MNNPPKTRKKGFTLIEVLAVVLIIGVMTAIAYPVYTKTITKSRAVEAINLLEMVRNKQISHFARNGEYITDFNNIGQLTGNETAEVKSDSNAILTVGKYELALNNATNCMSAAYIPSPIKSATFTFSSSYEKTGLGCDGDICKSFSNIVGDAKSVCNCEGKTCMGNFNLNEKTCSCNCPLQCKQNDNCFDKSQNQSTSQSCGHNGSGTQRRTCTASCGGGDCTGWGACVGEIKECSSKPAASQPCASTCGTQTRSVTCDNTTGKWILGVWTANCPGTIKCSTILMPAKGEYCDASQCICPSASRDNGKACCEFNDCGSGGFCRCVKDACPPGMVEEDGVCKPTTCPTASKPVEIENCKNCGTRTRAVTCNALMGDWVEGAWGACKGSSSQDRPCSATCSESEIRICTDDVWGEWRRTNCK